MVTPLQNIRVTDVTTVLAGPFCSMMLADLGAEVIKVEPLQGEEGRRVGPPFQNNESHLFLGINRNKKSIAVDLKKSEGREIVYKLVARSDIFLENSRFGTMEKLGLDYDTLSRINPGLIYSSTTGFGLEGPQTRKAAYELVLQGYSSVMDRGDDPPQRDKSSVVDVPTGMMATIGIMGALYHRRETGEGQRVDTSLLGSVLAIQSYRLLNGEDKSQPGFVADAGAFPAYRTYPTADGYINMAVLNEKHYKKMCIVLGVGELGDDPRYNSSTARYENRDRLIPVFEEILLKKSTDEWLRLLDERGVPCGRVNKPEDLFKDEQILTNDFLMEQKHPRAGTIQAFGLPIKMEKTPLSINSPAPLLGQHTDEVMGWLGYNSEEIHTLKGKNVIGGLEE